MAMRPFKMTTRPGHHGAPSTTYQGPFGPLISEHTDWNAVAHQPGIAITGPHVGLATFAWIPTPRSAKGGISDSEQLRLGLTITVDGTIVRLTSKLGFLTRAGRAIRIERPGQDRRYRLRGLWARSLETDTGQRLVQTNTSRGSGTVSDAADVIDVVLIIVLAHIDLDSMITKF